MNAQQMFVNLALVANIDGEIAFHERLLLNEYAKKLKIGFMEAQQLLDEVKSGQHATFAKPKSPEARRKLYKAMVKIVRSDGKITKEEQQVLKRIGNLLHIDEQMMQAAVLPQLPADWNQGAL